jgi:hypothetical protein
MPFSTSLAGRVRDALSTTRHISEQRLFGGLGFLLHGNLLVAIWHDALIVRVGPDAYESALREPATREFDITGRPMRGWVVVAAEGVDDDRTLHEWIDRADQFVRTLPAKAPAQSTSPRPSRRDRNRRSD